MKLSNYIFLFMCTFLLASCGDDDDGTEPVVKQPGDVKINLDAYFGEEDLSMNKLVDFDGDAFRINVSEFYVSDLTLVGGSGDVVLADVDYVNFTQTLGEDAETTLSYSDVPAGTYTKLTLNIGVNATNNARKPADFLPMHPLGNSSNYWNGWQSYIFSKLEGKLDTSGDGVTNLTYVYHSGKNDLFTPVTITFDTPVVVADGGVTDINLKMDHKVLFESGDSYLDIEASPSAHNPDDLTYPTTILGNFQSAIKN